MSEKENNKLYPVPTLIFQLTMTGIGVWLFLLGYQLSSFNPQFQGLNKKSFDSVMTSSKNKDSCKVGSKTTEIIKTEFTIKTNPQDCPECFKDRMNLAYSYFMLSVGIFALAFFLPRVQSFTFKDMSVTVAEAVEKKVAQAKNELAEVVNTNVEETVGSGGKSSLNRTGQIHIKGKARIAKLDLVEDDPQKNQWGGLSENRKRHLKAQVIEIAGTKLFNVYLTVESTNPNNPLSGKVKFHLHNTFTNQDPVVVVQNGIASLSLVAWGAFTVGAEADFGETILELDLASDEVKAPKLFKESL